MISDLSSRALMWSVEMDQLEGYLWTQQEMAFVNINWLLYCYCINSKAGDTLSSLHVSSRDVTSAVGIFNIEFWRTRTLVTLLTSRDLTWSSGRLTCQHASQISIGAHVS
jgi:hypothetical protein